MSTTGIAAEPPETVTEDLSLSVLTGRVVKWHEELRPVFRWLVTATVFVVMAALYNVILLRPQYFQVFAIISAGVTPVMLLAMFVAHKYFKRHINDLAAAALFSSLPAISFASVYLGLIVWERTARSSQTFNSGYLVIAAIALVLVTAYVAIFKMSSGNKSDRDALLEALPVVLGIATVMLVFRVLNPDLGPEGTDSRSTNQAMFGSLACVVAIVSYYWRRLDVGAYLIWPLSAWVVCIALGKLNFDFETPAYRNSPNSFTDTSVHLVFYGFLPAIIWWIFQLYIHRQAGKLDTSDRFGVRIKALYRSWERNELVGIGAFEKLPHRRDQLFNDLAYVAVSIAAFISFSLAAAESRIKEEVWVPFALAFLAIGYLALYSLAARALWTQRIRFSASVPVAILGAPITFGLSILLWDYGKSGISGLQDEHILAISVIVWLATQHLLLRLFRNVNFTSVRVRAGALALLGCAVSFVVFRMFMGKENLALFDVGIPIGDAGWLMTILFLSLAYLFHYREKSSFIIWPIGAAAAGTMLSIIVRTEAQIGQTAEFLAVKASMGEVLLAAMFGAAAGSLGLLAKQIWYDKDPAKRARAIRVVGFFTIVYAIAPVLLLVLFLSIASSFRNNASVVVTDALGNVTQLTISVVKIKDRAQEGVIKLKAQADDVITKIELLPANTLALTEELKQDGKKILDQSTAAAKTVAVAAGEQAKQAATQTLNKVGDAIGDALTIPDIDLGFLGTIEFPDLGIGKAFKNMISGLIPDFNLEALFQQAMASLYADVEKEFAAPIATAMEMQGKVTSFVSGNVKFVTKAKDDVIKETKAMVDDILAEKKKTLAIIEALVVNAVTFFYQLLTFLILTTATIIGYLFWKVMNGLFIMAIRIAIGWKMLRYAIDVTSEGKTA